MGSVWGEAVKAFDESKIRRWPKGTPVDAATGAGGGRFAPKDSGEGSAGSEDAGRRERLIADLDDLTDLLTRELADLMRAIYGGQLTLAETARVRARAAESEALAEAAFDMWTRLDQGDPVDPAEADRLMGVLADLRARRDAGQDVMAWIASTRPDLDLPEIETPPDPVSYQPLPALVEAAQRQLDMHVEGYAEERGIRPDDVMAGVRAVLHRVFSGQYPVSVRADDEDAVRILREGRFKTQFETGDSNGMFDPNSRSRAENTAMGVPLDIDPRLRPIYGYMAIPGSQRSVQSYGNVQFVLKDRVRDRATFTLGDSLHVGVTAAPIRKYHEDASRSAWVPGAVGGAFGVFKRGTFDKGELVNYVEVQIHGGLTIHDVERIVIHAPRLRYDEPDWRMGGQIETVLALAERRGIPVTFAKDEKTYKAFDESKIRRWPAGTPVDPATGAGGGRFMPKDGAGADSDLDPEAEARMAALPSVDERVWAGEQEEWTGDKVSKLAAGELGEDLAAYVLTALFGEQFYSVNAGINNAPIDLVGDGLAVEVKTGLSSNGRTAWHWRATIGEPGKAEKELLKQMTPEEKRAHNAWKAQAILDRKHKLVQDMSEETGERLEAATVGIIMTPDGARADLYLVPGFHLRLPWPQYATEEYYVGTYDLSDIPQRPLPPEDSKAWHLWYLQEVAEGVG